MLKSPRRCKDSKYKKKQDMKMVNKAVRNKSQSINTRTDKEASENKATEKAISVLRYAYIRAT